MYFVYVNCINLCTIVEVDHFSFAILQYICPILRIMLFLPVFAYFQPVDPLLLMSTISIAALPMEDCYLFFLNQEPACIPFPGLNNVFPGCRIEHAGHAKTSCTAGQIR